jgi:hypothetical protein
MDKKFILLYGVDQELFDECFGAAHKWPCRLIRLETKCPARDLTILLQKKNLVSVVFEDAEAVHFGLLKSYYEGGGLIACFGIDGEPATPTVLSDALGLHWRYYTFARDMFTLTPVGKHYLGTMLDDRLYTRANLLLVPEEDRLMVPKPTDVEDFLFEDAGFRSNTPSLGKVLEAMNRYEYENRVLGCRSPLAMHLNDGGGRIVFFGFVNGDGYIPQIVRAICSNMKL